MSILSSICFAFINVWASCKYTKIECKDNTPHYYIWNFEIGAPRLSKRYIHKVLEIIQFKPFFRLIFSIRINAHNI